MARSEAATSPSTVVLLAGLIVGSGGLAGWALTATAPSAPSPVISSVTASSQAGSAGDADRILEQLLQGGVSLVPPVVKFTDEVWANDVQDINVDEFLTGELVSPSVRVARSEEILDLYRPSGDAWSGQ